MCEVCENNNVFNYTNIEYGEEGYELVIQTSEWDDYRDGWVYERIDINYCPFCGRKLGGLNDKKRRL
ncbi:MAG: hypothetical protein E6356_13935 [Terrisporobacter othiniensis]|nr:hypothetical protein [Terrisporobacter othiniensis]